VRHLGHADSGVVVSDLVPILAVVAVAVVVLVGTVGDRRHADLVVVLDLAGVAELCALAAGGALHAAVRDRRAAQVVLDFDVGVSAVEAGARAPVVFAAGDCRDAHVLVLGQVVAVQALEALAVAVVVVAVGDGRHAGAVLDQRLARGARGALAAVALAALDSARRRARERRADALCVRVRERDAVLLIVVCLARLALEALLGVRAEVGGDEAMRQVVRSQERGAVLLALRDLVRLENALFVLQDLAVEQHDLGRRRVAAGRELLVAALVHDCARFVVDGPRGRVADVVVVAGLEVVLRERGRCLQLDRDARAVAVVAEAEVDQLAVGRGDLARALAARRGAVRARRVPDREIIAVYVLQLQRAELQAGAAAAGAHAIPCVRVLRRGELEHVRCGRRERTHVFRRVNQLLIAVTGHTLARILSFTMRNAVQ